MERTKMPNLRNGSKGGFEPGLTWLRVRHSTTELPRSIIWPTGGCRRPSKCRRKSGQDGNTPPQWRQVCTRTTNARRTNPATQAPGKWNTTALPDTSPNNRRQRPNGATPIPTLHIHMQSGALPGNPTRVMTRTDNPLICRYRVKTQTIDRFITAVMLRITSGFRYSSQG